MAERIAVFVRDNQTGKLRGQLDTISSLQWVERWQELGTWTLEVPRGPQADLLVGGRGLIVEVDGEPWASGPVQTATRKARSVTVSGPGDGVLLARMLARPAPLGGYNEVERDVRTGQASEVAAQFVDLNAGQGAVLGRRVLAVLHQEPFGPTLTAAARFEALLAVLRRVLVPEGLGFRVMMRRGQPLPVFEVLVGRDRRRLIEFSESRETLAEDSTITIEAPAATHAIAGGAGEGTERVFGEAVDPSTEVIWGRTEVFVDARETDADLDQSARAALSGPLTNAAVVPIERASAYWGTGGWLLGDQVDAVVYGVARSMFITEATLTYPQLSIRPLLTETATVLGQRSQLLAERVAALEGRT